MLMSKDTPEVGDVWEFKTKRRYSIIQLVDNDNGCECIVKKGHNIDKEIHIVTKRFIELNCVYLGKSKANIDDLFKTENEE